jgi:hypothetical protein
MTYVSQKILFWVTYVNLIERTQLISLTDLYATDKLVHLLKLFALSHHLIWHSLCDVSLI